MTRLAHPTVAAFPLLRGSLLALLAATLIGCGGGGGGSPTASPPASGGTGGSGTDPNAAPLAFDASTTCGLADFKAVVVQQVSAARAQARSCGAQAMPAVAPVAWNDALFMAAAGHSRDMAVNNYFSHTSLDGRSFTTRVTAAGYPWLAVGENIAAGYPSVADVMAAWLASPEHCVNIMGQAYTEVAVSCAQKAGTTFSNYWTMELGHR